MLDGILDDIRFVVRANRRSAVFALTAVCTIALGTGATGAVFSILEGVALRALPYRQPQQLVTVWETDLAHGLSHEPVSPVSFLDYRRVAADFDDMAGWWRPQITMTDVATGNPIRVSAIETSENLFRVLGVTPYLGRGFSSESTLMGTVNECVISYALWQSRYGGDRSVLGRTVRLNGYDYALVGVMPPAFGFPGKTELWQGLRWDFAHHSRGARFLETVARLKNGVDPDRAARDVATLGARLATDFPETNAGWSARLIPLDREVAGVFRPVLLALFGAALLLLVIACTNVTALLLARAHARRRELAVRIAVGASPARLARLLLIESGLLAGVGSALGFVLAVLGVKGFLHWSPIELPRATNIAVDPWVVTFAAVMTLATALVVGLLPVVSVLRTDVHGALKARAGNTSTRGASARSTLVVAEVGLAVMLLAGAGVLIRTVSHLLREVTGVDPRSVVSVDVQLPDAAYVEWRRVDQFYSRLADALSARPQVAAVGATEFLPLEAGWRMPFEIVGAAPVPAQDRPTAQFHTVDDGYFATLHIPVIRGRAFNRHDDSSGAPVVIVSEALAQHFWPGQNPIGRRMLTDVRQVGPLGYRTAKGNEHQVVGVVGDVKNTSLRTAAEPALFFSVHQFPFRAMHIVVRGQGEPAQLGALVREEVNRLDPTLAVTGLETMERTLTASTDPARLALILLGAFAALALALATIGIYGILTYMIGQRQKEFGIRLALGATPMAVLRTVVREGLLLTALGCIFGVLAASLGNRALAALLYGVTPWDPVTLGMTVGVVVLVAAVTCVIPGGRAAVERPLAALRVD
jgi:predicted permease